MSAPILGLLRAGQAVAGQVELPPLAIPEVEYSALLPGLILVVGTLVLLTVNSLARPRLPAAASAVFTVVTALAALVASGWLWNRVQDDGAFTALAGALAVDGFSVFLTTVILAAVALGALLAHPYLRRERLDGAEFDVLMMLSASGGIIMAAANDLLVLFLGLEILSIALYVMAGYHARRAESREAAIKYFVLGSFSSALFLYGVALVYGATGSTNLTRIAAFLAQNVITDNAVMLAGMVLLLVGLGFKVAAVPFHTWTPDVYQGSPTPATGFMAAAAKAAGFAGLLRVFFSTFSVLRLDWQPVVWALAVLTLVVGSVLAVAQNDIKRMLAYSSISHAGYILVGLQAANTDGIAGALFYLLAYSFMIVGSFAVVSLVGRRGDARHQLDVYRGLSARRPALALAFTVFLLAQAGVPLTSGFLAKFYVILAAVRSESYALALIAMLAAVVSAFVYLRVVVYMYMAGDEGVGGSPLPVPAAAGLALAVTVAVTLVAGVVPAPFLDFARDATLL